VAVSTVTAAAGIDFGGSKDHHVAQSKLKFNNHGNLAPALNEGACAGCAEMQLSRNALAVLLGDKVRAAMAGRNDPRSRADEGQEIYRWCGKRPKTAIFAEEIR